MSSSDLAWQPSLLEAATEPGIDESFSSLSRLQLDVASWVDHAPGWVAGSDRLFAELLAGPTGASAPAGCTTTTCSNPG
jgi:hypothetical protein